MRATRSAGLMDVEELPRAAPKAVLAHIRTLRKSSSQSNADWTSFLVDKEFVEASGVPVPL